MCLACCWLFSIQHSSLLLLANPRQSSISPSHHPPPVPPYTPPNAHTVHPFLLPPLTRRAEVLLQLLTYLLGTLSTKSETVHVYSDVLHAESITTRNSIFSSELEFFITYPPTSTTSSLDQEIGHFISQSQLASTPNSFKFTVLLKFGIPVFNIIYSLWHIRLLMVHTMKLLLPVSCITSTSVLPSSVILTLSPLLPTN